METRPRNTSFDGDPVEFLIDSSRVVLLDPLTLDALKLEFQQLDDTGIQVAAQRLHALASETQFPMRFGLYATTSQGKCRLDVANIVKATDSPTTGAPLTVVDVDSGALLAVDLAHLPALARILTWGAYDLALQGTGFAGFDGVTKDLGGAYYALISSPGIGKGFEFDGDGAYCFRDGALTQVSSPGTT